jgi:HSP20 family molecular chaperone IbpA
MSLLNTFIPSIRRSQPACADAACTESAVQKPVYRVTETETAYQLTVQLPGVAKDGVEVTSDADEIRITGRRAWKQPEGWTALHRESDDAAYELVLTHDNAINSEAIAAGLRDGVLDVTLPKAEAIKPRKIAVG